MIKDEQEAYKAVQSVYDRIGADSTTRLELSEIRPTEENVCYTFAQMAQSLPWCMKSAGYPQYEDAVRKALEETGYSNRELPDNAGEGKALITFTYSAPEKYQDYDPAVMLYDIDDSEHSIYTWPEGSTGQVAIVVPEGKYVMTLILENEEDKEKIYYLYSEDGWESYDREGIDEKFGDLDPESVIEAGSGERKELDAPEW